jgi:hypothetical protein
MANANVNLGFKIWDVLRRATIYAVQTAPTINIMVQDMVLEEIAGLVSPKLGMGTLVYDAAVIPANPGDNFLMLGSVLECFDEKMDPIAYIAAGRVGDGTVAGYVLVADHPDQRFMANVDTAIAVADLDLNYDIASEALSAGWTDTGLSKQRIAVSGAAVTVTLPIRMVTQAYPGVDVDTAAGCRMVCQINPLCHKYGAGVTI